jgi:hypothetical protein
MILFRIFLALSLIVILPWAYVSELFRGIRRAFLYAWLDVRIEMESARELWDNGPRKETKP